jgi:hypothetical protein
LKLIAEAVDFHWQDKLPGLAKSLEKWVVGNCGLENMYSEWGTPALSISTK